jgi:hypothetical protein
VPFVPFFKTLFLFPNKCSYEFLQRNLWYKPPFMKQPVDMSSRYFTPGLFWIMFINCLKSHRSYYLIIVFLFLSSNHCLLKVVFHFLVYPLARPIIYLCIFYTICKPLLLIYVVLEQPIRHAVCLIVHILLKESFHLHQPHVHPCMPCLVLWISAKNNKI